VTAAAAASGSGPLAAHVRLVRAAADLIEQAGIPGLALYPEPDEIVIQVPEGSGDVPARAAIVARLAALTGCQPGPDQRPGRTLGWLQARGTFAGHPVHVFAPIRKEQPS
jgi:hypothetical protein